MSPPDDTADAVAAELADEVSGSSQAGGVAFLLSQVGALAAEEFARRIRPFGLTAPEAGLLRSVGRRPGRSQQAIAGELGVHPSRLVAFVDGLERSGWLERRRDPSDRRRHEVHLTSAGAELLERLSTVAQAHDDVIAASLDAAERQSLHDLLRKIANAHGLPAGVHPGYRSL